MNFLGMFALRTKTVAHTFLPSFDNKNCSLRLEMLLRSRNFGTILQSSKNVNSCLFFWQAALSLCLPRATSCLSQDFVWGWLGLLPTEQANQKSLLLKEGAFFEPCSNETSHFPSLFQIRKIKLMLYRLLPVIVQIKLLTNGLCLGGERPAVRQAHRHPSIIYVKFQSSLPGTRSSEQMEFSLLFFPYKPHLFILFSNNKKFALNYHCRSKEKERKKEGRLRFSTTPPAMLIFWSC